MDELLALVEGLCHQLDLHTQQPAPGLSLTSMEARLLFKLHAKAPRVVSEEALTWAIWQGEPNALDTLNMIRGSVARIRRKLVLGRLSLTIKTCRSLGYALAGETDRLQWSLTEAT